MGDILHALPAVTALRREHPAWEIGWMVEPRWQALLAAPGCTVPGPGMPVVDRLHFAASKEWRKRPLHPETLRAILGLRAGLRERYDVVLDLQGAIRSAVLGTLAGCRRRIGEDAPRERQARWLFTERVYAGGAHVIEQDMELAAAVAGDLLEPVAPELPMDPAAEAWCDALLAGAEQPVALINPGAGWGAKRWPTERYAAVARGLTQRGLRVMVNTGPGEEALTAAMIAAAGGAATGVTPTLSQLIALTRRIQLCVAGDTGPLHLACALRKPVVGIYGPTDPSRNGPFGTRFRVLRSPMSQRDHTRRPEPEAGLLTIQPEEVLSAAEELRQEESQ